jgi:hypothetical protein
LHGWNGEDDRKVFCEREEKGKENNSRFFFSLLPFVCSLLLLALFSPYNKRAEKIAHNFTLEMGRRSGSDLGWNV